ncbi:hypothetical protein LXA43DRAFT_1151405 [Ganoderma leucocontextum]|nr:hypothetical protein LXA43DRAFT_1151405 [Ganoderma leucocontextum]
MNAVATEVEPITLDDYYDYLDKLKRVEPVPLYGINLPPPTLLRSFYNSCCDVYATEILRKGAKAFREEYVFSPSANLVPSGPKHDSYPCMLNRLLARLLHPLIYAGYGLEFGLSGLLGEGLGQAATHPVDGREIIPFSRFKEITSATQAAALFPDDILGRVTIGKRYNPVGAGLHKVSLLAAVFNQTMPAFGKALAQLADEWYEGDTDVPGNIIELFSLNAVIYTVSEAAPGAQQPPAASSKRLPANAPRHASDLPALLRRIPLPGLLRPLVRAYFSTCPVAYISRGCPALPLAAVTATPKEPGTIDAGAPSPNLWLPHPATRAPTPVLAPADDAPRGFAFKAKASLGGAMVLDGSLFVRVAGLTAGRAGWMREGEEDAGWDRVGCFQASARGLNLKGHAWAVQLGGVCAPDDVLQGTVLSGRSG